MKLFFSLLFVSLLFAQKANAQHSFYDIEKINNNEYWIGGKHGNLVSVDTFLNKKSIQYPTFNYTILKILNTENSIYLFCKSGFIYKYNKQSKQWIFKQFSHFKNKCFYDACILKNNLIVCGGTNGIANGEKKIPHGFIASIDTNLTNIDIYWKSYRKFVWSLNKEHDTLIASEFNGFNSHILKKTNNRFKKSKKIKGLVHEINMQNDTLFFSGCKNIHYDQQGMLGFCSHYQTQYLYNNTGCIWSFQKKENELISFSNQSILKYNQHNKIIHKTTLNASTLYDSEWLNDKQLIIVGQNGFVDLFTIKN